MRVFLGRRFWVSVVIALILIGGGAIMWRTAKQNEDAKWFSSPDRKRTSYNRNIWAGGGPPIPDRPPLPFAAVRIEKDAEEIRVFRTEPDPPMACRAELAPTHISADENGVVELQDGSRLTLKGVSYRPAGSDGSDLTYFSPFSGKQIGRRVGDSQHSRSEYPGVKIWLEASDDFAPMRAHFAASCFVDSTRTGTFARADWFPDEKTLIVDSSGPILYQTARLLALRFVHGEPEATEIPLEPGAQGVVGGAARYQFFDFNRSGWDRELSGPTVITYKRRGPSVSEPVLGRLNPNYCYSQVELRLTGSKGSQTHYLYRDGKTNGFSSRRLGRLRKFEVLFRPYKTTAWFRIPKVPNSALPDAEDNLFNTVVDLPTLGGNSPSIFADFVQFVYRTDSAGENPPDVAAEEFGKGLTVRELIERFEKLHPEWKILPDSDQQLLLLKYGKFEPKWYQKIWLEVRGFFGG
ncbi:MAG: hypothetical protein ACI8UO_001145 [Verrucomicrobiales bacterium]|jgi:hypothetical protein